MLGETIYLVKLRLSKFWFGIFQGLTIAINRHEEAAKKKYYNGVGESDMT